MKKPVLLPALVLTIAIAPVPLDPFILKFCCVVHVFGFARFNPIVLVVLPLYPPASVRVEFAAVNVARFNDEVASWVTAPFVAKSNPFSDATDRPPVVVVDVTDRVPVAVTFPPKYELPATSRRFEGEVVPIPTELAVTVNVGVAEYPTWKVESVEFVNPAPKAVEIRPVALTLLPQANEA